MKYIYVSIIILSVMYVNRSAWVRKITSNALADANIIKASLLRMAN